MAAIALSAAGQCSALDAEPEVSAGVGLVMADASSTEGVLRALPDLLAQGGLKVAARTDQSVFIYVTPDAAALLEAKGVDLRPLVDDVGAGEIYLIPKVEGIDLEALEGDHRILAETGSHYLVAADPGSLLEIHLLPFKQRLPRVWESGLPLTALRPLPVKGAAAPLTYSPLIQEMVDSVSQSRLYTTLNGLSGENPVTIGGETYTISTRYSPTQLCKKAGQYILETFQAMGLEAEYDYFNFRTLMKAVTFPVDNQKGWIVGKQMMVLHTEDGGEVWAEQHTGNEGALNDIVMVDASAGCVVGNNGIVLVTDDGTDWERVYPPTSNDLNALCFTDDSTAYCCGAGGVILKSTDRGNSWTALTSGTGHDLNGICFAGAATGWVVGEGGVIRKTENAGSTWTPVTSPVSVDLLAVTCHDEYTAWACGSSGTMIRTDDGDEWLEVTTPTSEDLKSVFFISSPRGWACGTSGALIKTLNGGATWNDLGFPAGLNLNDVYFVNDNEGWMVGLGAIQHTTMGGLEWEDQRDGVLSGDVNVVATMEGTTDPEEIYIICGHYDSISPIPETYAPGADDNGTGTVGVIEAARVLRNYSFESTLRFVCFSREEQGLVGSNAYAGEARARGDSIVGALNFDMIGYVDVSPEELDVLYNDISGWLADEYETAASLYVPGLDIKKTFATQVGSDNTSFWNYGYPSFCGIEDAPPNNPNYHRTSDRVSTLDFDFYTDVVKAAVASLARLARVDTVSSSVAGVFGPPVFRVSPNPGRGEVSIEMSLSGSAPEAFHIYSVEGRLVNTLVPEAGAGSVWATWPGTDLQGSRVGPGVYFLRPAGQQEGAKIVLLK